MSDRKDKHSDLHTFIEPELEARVVAWVLGEASAFEAAELERLVAEKPELALFKRRLEAVHGLIGEAVGPETESLRLSSERRTALLAKISDSGPTSGSKVNGPGRLSVFSAVSFAKLNRYVPAAAACAMAAAILTVVGVRLGLVSNDDLGADSISVVRPSLAQSGSEALEHAQEKSLTRSMPGAGLSPEPASGRELDLHAPTHAGDGVSRRRTELADIGDSISVFTDGYIVDIGAADNRTLLEYTMNTAVGGVLGNFVNGESDRVRELASADNRRDMIVLSPFEVTSDEDTGYNAATTLAGNRLNTRLRDIGNAVSIYPDQFLVDTGAANHETLLQYGVSTEFDGKRGDAGDEDQIVMRPLDVTTDFRAEVQTSEEAVSTFSLHVSDVSFRLVQSAIANQNFDFDPSAIRQEEFYNAFDYGDPAPLAGEKVSARIEQAAHPLMQQRNLVRIAMRVPATGRGAGQPLRLTVALDTSGSMEREDRKASVRAAIGVLASLLGPDDRVTLVGFARTPRLLDESVPGDQAGRLVDVVARTPAEGGTNIEDALALSINMAQRQFDPAAQNRIVLITDGAANLGNADPASLSETIEAARQQGIAFDACGVGADGLDDAMLEALTRKGDGRYYLLDSEADADERFARRLAGAFRPAAEDVKVQVMFNPARVGSHRLIGFESHRLNEEDFRNDAVDAAELAAEEAAVALYQVEVLPDGEGELGEVFVRFRDTATQEMVERSWTMPFDPQVRPFDQATPSMQLAGTSAIFADNLKAGAAAEGDWLDELAPVVNSLRGHYRNEERVQEFVRMYEEVRRMARN